MNRWSGKVAVVTGASSGIGAALSVRLANCGLTVVGLARRQHRVDCQSKRARKNCFKAATFGWVEQTLGGVDILVNNAGILKFGNITNIGNNGLNDDDIFAEIDINFKGVVACTRKAIASMKKREVNGHVVNISSIAGHYIPFDAKFNVYSATKHAVTAFSSALMNELADLKSHVRVTNISPGLVSTEMVAGFDDKLPYLKPDDVVDAIIYALATPPTVNINEIIIEAVTEKRL